MNTRCAPRQLAADLCSRSACRVQVAAVLSDRHGIFSWGWNHAGSGYGVHAEEHALSRANSRRLRGATLTIFGRYRINRHCVCSRPCEQRCMPLAKRVGIETIEYVIQNGAWVVLKLSYARSR